MPNRLFYTVKLHSEKIIANKLKINMTFEELLRHGNIISLADSQMLKLIRQLTHHEINLEQLEEWYLERDKIKKRANSKENREVIKKLQKQIYDMMYIPEYITIVIDKEKDYHTLFKKGFYFNDSKYTRFSCSASQARVSTVVFIKDEIKEQMKEMLDNGRRLDKPMAPSKYNAYFGLYSSAIHEVSAPRFCIIPDFLEEDVVKVDFVTTTDDWSDDIIDERDIMVEFNRFDGNGLISPQMAEQWSKDIGLYHPEDEEDRGYIACQFCIRQSFTKGMLNTFDFLKFCELKNNGNYIIKDVYGNDVDLREIDVILTEGQTKLWDSFGYWEGEEFIPSQKVFEDNIKKNGLVWGVTRYTPEEDDTILIANYQFLQTLKMNDNDIKELCQRTVDYLEGCTYREYWYTLLFLLGEKMTDIKIKNYMKSSNNYWLKTLICNPELRFDKYSKEKVRDAISKRMEQACIGKILLQGNFQVLIPDSYAFMEWCCYRDPSKVIGLLKAGECYSKFWKDRDKKQILSQRSPLTHFSECHLMNVKWNDEIDEWFKYSYTGFYLNVHDDSVMRYAGADFDYDIVASTDNPVMIRSVYKNQKPVTYDIPKPFKKIFTEQDLFEADCKTFGSLIGPLTNQGTSIIALISDYRQKIENEIASEEDIKKFNLLNDRLKMVCAGQSRQIDKAKIGENVKGFPKIWKTYQPILQEDSEEVKQEKEFYNSILSDRKPYFFRYVYKREAKKLEKYMKKMNRNCDNLYNMFIKDLEKLEDKTEEQINFLKNLDKGNGFINSNCEMNRMCRYLESVKRNINVNVRDNKSFDYRIFYNDNIEFDEELYQEISDAITSDLKNLEAIRSKINNKFLASQEEQEENIVPVDYIKNIRNNLITNYCSNKYELLNYCLEYFFEKNKTASKSIFWELVGDVVYEKSLEQCDHIIKFPEKDKDGDIEFLNKKYKLKTVYLEEDVSNEQHI